MKDVRVYVSTEDIKKAHTHASWMGGEFWGPNEFYWHGKAHCRWEARANGWLAYLNKFHPGGE